MPALKKIHPTRVIEVKPTHLLKKDALKFTSMNKDTFRQAAEEFNLTVYRRGPKKVWYKISELTEMLNSYKMPDEYKKIS